MILPQSVAELAQALVRIPSINPQGCPETAWHGERNCAEFVAQFLDSCGAEVELVEVEPGRPNVIGRFPSDRPEKQRVLLAPHTDTVGVDGMTIDPFGGEIREGRLHGRGATDTKGPMAAMLWALNDLRETIPELGCEISFAGLVGEEAGQNGAHHFVKNNRVDFALIAEPTGLDIVHTHKGSAWVSLKTHGSAAHSSRPELGDNAITKMLDLLAFIREELTPEFAAIIDPVLGSPTVSIATISGGTKTNIVPDACEATIDLRTVPSQYTTDFVGELAERLRRVCPDAEIHVKRALPLYTDPDNPFIRALEKAGGQRTGAPWFCDAAVFAGAGMPAVAVGPGSINQAHTEDEWIAIDDLQRGVDFYKEFLRSL